MYINVFICIFVCLENKRNICTLTMDICVGKQVTQFFIGFVFPDGISVNKASKDLVAKRQESAKNSDDWIALDL